MELEGNSVFGYTIEIGLVFNGFVVSKEVREGGCHFGEFEMKINYVYLVTVFEICKVQ